MEEKNIIEPAVEALKRCPVSPNCVSSLASDQRHYIAPIRYQGTWGEAKSLLLEVIRGWSRSRIVSQEGRLVRVEFRSALFRFVDDAEFWFDQGDSVIQVRSAARVGYYDFGVNRKRMESIRSRITPGG